MFGPRSQCLVVSLVSLALAGCDTTKPMAPRIEEQSTASPQATVNPPSSLTAAATSETRIDLAWLDNSTNETAFEIRRSTTGPDGSFPPVATTAANATSYADAGLTPATQYCYKVRAVSVGRKATTYSTLTAPACATTPAPAPITQLGQIAFEYTFCEVSDEGCYTRYRVAVMRPDGSNVVDVASDGTEPTWSPSAAQIAFRSLDGEIMVVNLADGSVVNLTNHSAIDEDPAWSPDGSKIAFTSYRDGQEELYVMNSDGSGPLRLTDNVGFVGFPSWSPDGARLAFDCVVDSDNVDVCAVNSDGTGFARLTSAPTLDWGAAWAPDGASIAFASWDVRVTGVGMIAVMTPDGSWVHGVAPGGQLPTWSPDGARIAFANGGSLYVMNADGTGVALLYGDNRVYADNPAWSRALEAASGSLSRSATSWRGRNLPSARLPEQRGDP